MGDDTCPLCEGDCLKLEGAPSEAMTRCASESSLGIQSLTTDASENSSNTVHGEYRGKVSLCAAGGYGTISSDAVKGGTIGFTAKSLVGPKPPVCKTKRGASPAGPAVSFDIQTGKKGLVTAVNVRVLEDDAKGDADAPGAPLPAPTISEAAPLAP